jgi:hypothetical protein
LRLSSDAGGCPLRGPAPDDPSGLLPFFGGGSFFLSDFFFLPASSAPPFLFIFSLLINKNVKEN